MRIMMMAACVCGAALFAAPAAAQGMTGTTLSADETTWHVRAALNVAALSCRDADERDTTAAYNSLLEQDRVPLAHAAAAVDAEYRARYGASWQSRNDGDMTRLYNFFAAPRAQAEFCAVAKQVLRESATVEPSDFAAFAAQALPALERPFSAPIEMAAQPPVRDGEVMIATSAPLPLAPGH